MYGNPFSSKRDVNGNTQMGVILVDPWFWMFVIFVTIIITDWK